IGAVLDWELAHIGDPMEDIGWLCGNSWRFGRMDKVVGGFGDLADLSAGYHQAGGAPIRIESCKWWEVFGTLRWGVMCATMTGDFPTTDPTVERAAMARPAILRCDGSLEDLNTDFAEALDRGRLSILSSKVWDHLWATTLAKLSVDQPAYSGYRAALTDRDGLANP